MATVREELARYVTQSQLHTVYGSVVESLSSGSTTATNYGLSYVTGSSTTPGFTVSLSTAPNIGIRKSFYLRVQTSNAPVFINTGSSAIGINSTANWILKCTTSGGVDMIGYTTAMWLLLSNAAAATLTTST